MIDRILDFSEQRVFVRTRLGQLIVSREGAENVSVPLDEIAAVVLAHPTASFTTAALGQLSARGGIAIFCDENNEPAGMVLPLRNHSTQQERMLAQSEASLPLKKRLWQQIVKAKIGSQARLLLDLTGEDAGLLVMADRVHSGDPANVEAQAAQRYWPRIFGEPAFRRKRDGGGPNALLNYGYAVLRAVTARAICAAGLHPSLALHHSNRYDTFCLADDLMEPFRPLVDAVVVEIVAESGFETKLTPPVKRELIGSVVARYWFSGEQRTLFDWLASLCSSLAQVYLGQSTRLQIPEIHRAPVKKKPVGVSLRVALRDVRSAG